MPLRPIARGFALALLLVVLGLPACKKGSSPGENRTPTQDETVDSREARPSRISDDELLSRARKLHRQACGCQTPACAARLAREHATLTDQLDERRPEEISRMVAEAAACLYQAGNPQVRKHGPFYPRGDGGLPVPTAPPTTLEP